MRIPVGKPDRLNTGCSGIRRSGSRKMRFLASVDGNRNSRLRKSAFAAGRGEVGGADLIPTKRLNFIINLARDRRELREITSYENICSNLI